MKHHHRITGPDPPTVAHTGGKAGPRRLRRRVPPLMAATVVAESMRE